MQLTCKVNQAEAIRRGFNPSSTVKIEVDVGALSPEFRELIAAHFSDGAWLWDSIPQPDLEGLLECLAKNAEADAKNKAAREEAARLENEHRQNILEKTLQTIAERKLTFSYKTLYVEREKDGNFSINPWGNDKKNGKADYKVVSPDWPFQSSMPSSIYKNPDYLAWKAEIDAANKTAEEDAFKSACGDLLIKEDRLAKTKAKEDELKAWAQEHGSPLLKYRIEEELDWLELAKTEWIKSLDLGEFARDFPDYSYEIEPAEDPSEDQIAALAKMREALKTKAPVSEARLVKVTYTSDDYEKESFSTIEIQVDVAVLGHLYTKKFFQA